MKKGFLGFLALMAMAAEAGIFEDEEKSKKDYQELIEEKGDQTHCVECGQCEGVCPQHLSIIQYLKDVAGHFEK